MKPQALFELRIRRLCKITAERQPEELLDLAGILRQLLIDTLPLLDVVNRKFRKKLRFRVSDSTEELIKKDSEKVPTLPLPSMVFCSIIPHKEEGRLINKDQFLRHSIIFLRPLNHPSGFHFTVKDIISICANRLGAVHYSPPEKDEATEALMRHFNQQTSLYGSPIAFGVLAEIGVVLLEAVDDLYQDILSELQA